jgi:predicted CXXCH cytochrome family protein
VFENEEHSDLDESDVCWDCHDPHGGDDRFLF